MKKTISLLLVILILPILATAEGLDEQALTGEWYIADSTEAMAQFTGKLESNGDITITETDGTEGIIHPDGKIEGPGLIMETTILRNEDIIMLYIKNTDELNLLLLLPTVENEYQGFTFIPSSFLFVNGRKIGTNGSVEEYCMIRDKLYMINDLGYTRGNITMYGNDCFLYTYERASNNKASFKFFIKADLID